MDLTIYPEEIQVFFIEIIDMIKEILDPDYILIAGSFGKESWLYSNQELISDFEFAFVCKKKWGLKKKSQLLKKLNNDYPYEIGLKGFLLPKVRKKIISNYASKNPGYISLDFFDTFSDPVFLYDKNGIDLNIDCKVDEIPIWEAWRLYVNRMADLLKLESVKNYDKKTEDYFWLKIFESTAGAYLIIKKLYHKNIAKRLDLFDYELINSDKELNKTCKNSFAIINKAMVARQKHDLAAFNIEINIKERKEIISSWMNYIENKLIIKESILLSKDSTFYKSYLNKVELQEKYLGFSYKLNKFLSNSIRLMYNPKLFNFNFKFYNHKISWRHIILLCISSVFTEDKVNNENFIESKKIVSHIVRKKTIDNLTREKFIEKILIYWKILR